MAYAARQPGGPRVVSGGLGKRQLDSGGLGGELDTEPAGEAHEPLLDLAVEGRLLLAPGADEQIRHARSLSLARDT